MKKLLQKVPFVYQRTQRIYYAFFALLERLCGTRIQELRWKLAHIIRKKQWAAGYRDTLHHPHRKFLIDRILSHGTVSRILEIGCNAGPNLILLAQRIPSTHFFGIDINHTAITEGKKWIDELDLKNISLSVGRADDLKKLPTQSIDYIFSDATMMYIGPDKIGSVIKEFIRVASKRIIFLEYHSRDLKEKGLSYDGHWVYNYATLFTDYVRVECISITPMPDELWESPGWKKYGTVIEVTL